MHHLFLYFIVVINCIVLIINCYVDDYNIIENNLLLIFHSPKFEINDFKKILVLITGLQGK